jgi:hypothetical protein
MRVLGIRFCSVTAASAEFAATLGALGLPQKTLPSDPPSESAFIGAVFPAGDSWIELWPITPGMPSGVMLQVVVDDADAFAAHARSNGLQPKGPMDAHGERIYFLSVPGGGTMSFQSSSAAEADG